MSKMVYLFLAFALIWTGTFGYLIRLASLRKQLEERIGRLEERTTAREPEDV